MQKKAALSQALGLLGTDSAQAKGSSFRVVNDQPIVGLALLREIVGRPSRAGGCRQAKERGRAASPPPRSAGHIGLRNALIGLLGRSGLFGFFCLGHGAIRCLGYGLLLRFNRAVAADAAGFGVGNLAGAPGQ